MKKLAALALVLLAACATSNARNSSQSTPGVDIRISGSNLQRETLMQGGTVGATFEFTITNQTAQPVMLRTVTIRSYGSNSFAVSSGPMTVRKTVAPGETMVIQLNTPAQSSGGYIATQEPVNIRGEALFEAGGKTFMRQFVELIDPR